MQALFGGKKEGVRAVCFSLLVLRAALATCHARSRAAGLITRPAVTLCL